MIAEKRAVIVVFSVELLKLSQCDSSNTSDLATD